MLERAAFDHENETIDINGIEVPLLEDPVHKIKKMKYVSAMQYYAYKLCDKQTSYLHLFGRLFHQYIVDMFSKIEFGRLSYIRKNQDVIRADLVHLKVPLEI